MSILEVGIVTGIGLGSAYGMVALAYNIVLASSGVFNLAQAGVITVSVVMTYLLGQTVGATLILVILCAVAVGGFVGGFSEIVAVRRFQGRQLLSSGLVGLTEETLVSTLGLSLAITAVVELTFGSNSRTVKSYVPFTPFDLGVSVQPIYLVLVGAMLAVGAALELFLRMTSFGLVTRAIIVDAEGASLLGTNVRRVIQVAFVVAGAIGGLAAFLISPITAASPFVGESLTLFGFAALAVGGFGSFRGAIVGGIIVGLVLQITNVYVNPNWGPPAVLVLMVVVLMVRPAGLFGRAGLFGSSPDREV